MKKLTFTKTEVNFANKLGYSLDEFSAGVLPLVPVANRFTGVTYQLPQFAAVLLKWIYDWSNRYELVAFDSGILPKGMTIKEFDMARALFRKLWPSEYMDLLD